MELSTASVFLDFDGTVTREDSGVHLLERLAPSGWETAEARYRLGEIGSRECLERQWAGLAGLDEVRLREVAREVALDPAFPLLLGDLRAAGAEVTVVSDGFGFYAEEVCGAAGVAVLTNRVDWSAGELLFPHADRCCPCSTCGTCKQAPIRDARRRGRTTVFVGDGVSDRKAALLVDLLFAKNDLADWCDEAGVEYRPFATLADVRRVLCG